MSTFSSYLYRVSPQKQTNKKRLNKMRPKSNIHIGRGHLLIRFNDTFAGALQRRVFSVSQFTELLLVQEKDLFSPMPVVNQPAFQGSLPLSAPPRRLKTSKELNIPWLCALSWNVWLDSQGNLFNKHGKEVVSCKSVTRLNFGK